MRMPKRNSAKHSSRIILRGRVLRDNLAPICAPITAPIPTDSAGTQTIWSSMIWEMTPKNEETAKTKWDVAVAICGGKARA